MQKTNWEPIKTEYVTTRTTYKELAVKYNVPFNTVKQRGRKYKWGAVRKEHSENVAKKTLQKVAEKEAFHEASQIFKLQIATDNLSTMIEGACRDIKMYKKHLVRIAESRSVDGQSESKTLYLVKEFEIANAKLMKDLSITLLNLTAAVRDLYGVPTIKEQSRIDIAAQRLQMDKQKAEFEDGANEVTVEFVDGVEELAE